MGLNLVHNPTPVSLAQDTLLPALVTIYPPYLPHPESRDHKTGYPEGIVMAICRTIPHYLDVNHHSITRYFNNREARYDTIDEFSFQIPLVSQFENLHSCGKLYLATLRLDIPHKAFWRVREMPKLYTISSIFTPIGWKLTKNGVYFCAAKSNM